MRCACARAPGTTVNRVLQNYPATDGDQYVALRQRNALEGLFNKYGVDVGAQPPDPRCLVPQVPCWIVPGLELAGPASCMLPVFPGGLAGRPAKACALTLCWLQRVTSKQSWPRTGDLARHVLMFLYVEKLCEAPCSLLRPQAHVPAHPAPRERRRDAQQRGRLQPRHHLLHCWQCWCGAWAFTQWGGLCSPEKAPAQMILPP